MSLVLVAGPDVEPLELQEAKDWARITETEEDELLTGILRSARAHVEQLSGRALITQTWDLWLDAWPYGCEGYQIDIPKPPLQSVTFIKYTDSTGVVQTLATSEYTVDNKAEPGRIVPAYGKSWPGTQYVPNAIQVRFVAGYGNEGTDVDALAPELRQAVGVLVATMYEQRESNTDTEMMDVPEAFYQLVAQHRMFWL